jgi:uncharacterized membrane protein
VRAELLPAVSSRRAIPRADRHVDLSRRIPLHRARRSRYQSLIVEELLRQITGALSLTIDAIAVLVVGWGAIESAISLVRLIVTGQASHGARKATWRRFGVWLLLGLEFELAADIVRTVVSPNWIDIGQLGAIAVIRTFLNYFLEKDLEHARETEPSTEKPGQGLSATIGGAT